TPPLVRVVVLLVAFDERPWPDETDITAQHVPQLRKFIETQPAQHASYPVQTLRIRQKFAFRIARFRHRAEFVDVDRLPPASESSLSKDDRPAESAQDQQPGEDQNRRKRDQQHASEHTIEYPFHGEPDSALPRC